MISFDRTSTNLKPIWNEINSLKSDTSSLYTMITAGGGVIPEELLNSITLLTSNTDILSSDITLLNNNTLYFNNELYSLKTNSASMILDTSSLNTDIGSLYNICNSLSDSISTITGGGGGGNYYLNISDILNSSLKYVYNITGNITAIPTYDSFTFHGNIGNFNDLSVDSSIKNFEIGDVDLISSITISTSLSSNRFNSVKLYGKTMTADYLRYISNCKLSFDEIDSCSFSNIPYLSINANLLQSNNIATCFPRIFVEYINYNSFSTNRGYLNCLILSKNSFYNELINALSLFQNTFSSIQIHELNNQCINSNSFYCGKGNTDYCCTPNFICSQFYYNTINNVLNDFNIECIICSGNYINNITLTGTSTVNTSRQINIIGDEIYRNYISDVWNVNINAVRVRGNWSFSNIHSINIKAESLYWGGGHGDYGGPNYMTNIDCLDIHEITKGFYIHTVNNNYIGVSTLKLNYNVSWKNPLLISTGTEVLPSNIYTLDFYNCDNYISNSIFTIPSYYSGYDEGNVWISGKPLSELGYTLSTSSA